VRAVVAMALATASEMASAAVVASLVQGQDVHSAKAFDTASEMASFVYEDADEIASLEQSFSFLARHLCGGTKVIITMHAQSTRVTMDCFGIVDCSSYQVLSMIYILFLLRCHNRLNGLYVHHATR